jgi:hypothetical protein
MKFVDLDGNHEINEADRTIIGDPNPDIYGNLYARFFIGKHFTVTRQLQLTRWETTSTTTSARCSSPAQRSSTRLRP